MGSESTLAAMQSLQLDLSPDALSALAEAMRTQKMAPGEYLMHQGDPGDSFHIVLSGSVEVVSHGADGREIVFRSLGRGDPIGELTVVDGSRRTASIRADVQTEVISIGRRQFLDVALAQSELGIWLAGLCAEKTRRLADWAEDRAFQDIGQRLAALILELAAERDGEHPPEVKVTQQALADRLGATRESVNKNLQSLATAGVLELSRGRIVILDPPALSGALQF